MSVDRVTAPGEAQAVIRIGFPWWLRPLLFRGTIAITLGRRIYIDRMLDAAAFEQLLRHELVHVRQARELGLIRFLWKYCAEYLRHRWQGLNHDQAYRSISLEAEAFAAEVDPPV